MAKEIVDWRARFAADAAAAAEMERGSAGEFFSQRGGVISFGGLPIPGNMMGVIILAATRENVWYEHEYDPDVQQSPACYAYGEREQDMMPHDEAPSPQSPDCESCEKNAWGSADKGRGKACSNTRRLALISAGDYTVDKFTPRDDPDWYQSAPVGYLKLPVTSVKDYSAYVAQLASAAKRPPYAVITRIRSIPHAAHVYRLCFDALMEAPDALMPTIMARHDAVASTIDFPYPVFDAPAPAQKRARKY